MVYVIRQQLLETFVGKFAYFYCRFIAFITNSFLRAFRLLLGGSNERWFQQTTARWDLLFMTMKLSEKLFFSVNLFHVMEWSKHLTTEKLHERRSRDFGYSARATRDRARERERNLKMRSWLTLSTTNICSEWFARSSDARDEGSKIQSKLKKIL